MKIVSVSLLAYVQAKEWAELDPEDRSQNFLPQRYMP